MKLKLIAPLLFISALCQAQINISLKELSSDSFRGSMCVCEAHLYYATTPSDSTLSTYSISISVREGVSRTKSFDESEIPTLLDGLRIMVDEYENTDNTDFSFSLNGVSFSLQRGSSAPHFSISFDDYLIKESHLFRGQQLLTLISILESFEEQIRIDKSIKAGEATIVDKAIIDLSAKDGQKRRVAIETILAESIRVLNKSDVSEDNLQLVDKGIKALETYQKQYGKLAGSHKKDFKQVTELFTRKN